MAANYAPVDSPAEESAVSTRRELGDSRTSCLDGQNTAERSQIPGEDSGARKKCSPRAPDLTQHHRLSSRRCAHRRKVDGSGKRVGSLQPKSSVLATGG